MRTAGLLLVALAVGIPGTAPAHPMGNFSISHYAGLEISPDSVRVKYLLDFAEIPSVRELELVDPDLDDLVTPGERQAYLEAKTAEVLANLRLEVNGSTLPIHSEWARVTFPPGEGGLSTVRIAWMLVSPLDSEPRPETSYLVWSDRNYEDRVGWKEIRIAGVDGIGIGKTSLRPSPTSGALSEYPEEYLWNPPQDTKAWCHFGPGLERAADAAFEPPEGFGGEARDDPFVKLIAAEKLSAGVVLVSLLLAIVLGAGHALEPGHGKTLVAAYLVGSKGTVGQAALLGLVVTVTHTFSVFLLGAGVLLLSQFFVPEKLLPWMGLVSGLLIATVGLAMLRARWREGSHEHSHHHPHHPEHDPAHSHVPAESASLGRILTLGISGGLVPCPAGIVVLLAAVALGRTAFGLLLIAAFSLGLAAVLVGVGILFVTARRLLDRLPLGGGFARRLGMVSASVVTVFGVVLAYRSLTTI